MGGGWGKENKKTRTRKRGVLARGLRTYLMKNVLCSNKFHLDSSQGASLEPEDEDWLKHNVMQAHLPKGKMWYLREDEQDMLLSQAEADEAAHQQLLAAAGA